MFLPRIFSSAAMVVSMIFFICTKLPYLWCTKIPTPCLHFPLPIPIKMCPPSGSHNSLLPPSVIHENCTSPQTSNFSHELLDSIFGFHVLFLFAAAVFFTFFPPRSWFRSSFAAAVRFPITIITASNLNPCCGRVLRRVLVRWCFRGCGFC